jgi:hypothetical protein
MKTFQRVHGVKHSILDGDEDQTLYHRRTRQPLFQSQPIESAEGDGVTHVHDDAEHIGQTSGVDEGTSQELHVVEAAPGNPVVHPFDDQISDSSRDPGDRTGQVIGEAI